MVSFNDKIIEVFGAWVTDYAPVLLLEIGRASCRERV